MLKKIKVNIMNFELKKCKGGRIMLIRVYNISAFKNVRRKNILLESFKNSPTSEVKFI